MKIILCANTAWYLYNFRLLLAEALRDDGYEVILVSPYDEYVEKLKSAGFSHITLSIKRKTIAPIADLITLFTLMNIYRKEQPILVHHFTNKCVIFGSLAAKWTGILKIVNSITGMGYIYSGGQFPRKLLRVIVRSLYRMSLSGTQLIFQNEDDKNELLQFNELRQSDLHTIQGSGVDLIRFHPGKGPPEPPVIVLVARMLIDKGVTEFIEAAKIIKNLGINARMILVGKPDSGNPASIPIDKLIKWSKDNIIEWWEWSDAIEEIYKKAHIVCLPSYREGLPKSLIEATACGLPIVTTNAIGCRDVVEDGVNGLLVPVGDADKLAEALIILISNPELRQKMGYQGRKIAEEKFDADLIISQTIAVYGYQGKN